MLESEKKKLEKIVNDKLAEIVPHVQARIDADYAEGGTLYHVSSAGVDITCNIRGTSLGIDTSFRTVVHLGVGSAEEIVEA